MNGRRSVNQDQSLPLCSPITIETDRISSSMNRPSPISRTVSSSSSASSSSSNSSTSLGMSPLQRPSLLRDLRQEQEDDYSIDEPNNNQTPWTVADTQLRPIPPFYPPLNPRCSAFILDSPPSVVASRISDCLKKRSISVQYDDEMVSRENNTSQNRVQCGRTQWMLLFLLGYCRLHEL